MSKRTWRHLDTKGLLILTVSWVALAGSSGLFFRTSALAQSATTNVQQETDLMEGQVPYPALVHLEKAVRDQLLRERKLLDDLVASASEPVEQAEAFGRMGQLYFLYDLLDAARACFERAHVGSPLDAQWPYYLAVLERFEGRLEQSESWLAKTLTLDQNNLPAKLRSAELLLEKRDFPAAEVLYKEIVEQAKESAAAHYGLGRALSGLGQHQTAVESFSEALRLQPQATSIHHSLGMAYRGLGDREKARYHLELNQHGAVAFDDPLVSDLANLVAGGSASLKLGNEAMKQGEVALAIEEYTRAAAANPESALIRYNLGTAWLARGSTTQAAEQFSKALELDPNHRDAHYNLGSILFGQGKVAEAEHHLARTHEIDPLDRQAHLDWAVALSRSGQTRRAVEEITRLVEVDPRNEEALRNWAVALSQVGRLGEETAKLHRTLQESPAGSLDDTDRASLGLQLAILQEANGQFDGAISTLEQVVQWEPEWLAAQLSLGRLYARSGRYGEAEQVFARSVSLDSSSGTSLTLQANTLLLMERYEEARVLLRGRLAEAPQDVGVAHLLARLLATCPDAAIRNGDRALRMAVAVFQTQKSVEHGATVAMALAETGEFQQAVDFQQRVVSLAADQGLAMPWLAEYLALYESSQPVRAPWMEEVGR